MQVADFLEAPTLPWAERACRLGLARECTDDARDAASALLATQTPHIQGLVNAMHEALDVETPLQAALANAGVHGCQGLTVRALSARLRDGQDHRRTVAGATLAEIQLDCVRGDDNFTVLSAAAHGSADGGRGLPLVSSHNASSGADGALAPPQLAQALSALRQVRACSWLDFDGRHGPHSTRCSAAEERSDSSADDDVGGRSSGAMSHDGSIGSAVLEGGAGSGVAAGGDGAAAADTVGQFSIGSTSATADATQLESACGLDVAAAAESLNSALAAPAGPLRLRTLKIADQPFSDAHAAALATSLALQTQLRRLTLRGCTMAPAAAVALLDAASQLPHLAALTVADMLHTTAADTLTLLACVPRFTGLTYLQLACTEPDGSPPAGAFAALAPLTALRHLALPYYPCRNSVECSRAVLTAVCSMARLVSFLFHGEVLRLTPESHAAFMAVAATLTRLTLGAQGTPAGAAIGIWGLRHLSSLEHIDIVSEAGESMAPPTARALAHALEVVPLLTHLNIGGARLCIDGVRVLAPAIGRLGALRELGLEAAFDLEGYSAEIPAALARHCSGLSVLCVLELKEALLQQEEADTKALAAWLRCLPRLEVVGLAQCMQDAGMVAAQCAALAQHAAVTCLDLSDQDSRASDNELETFDGQEGDVMDRSSLGPDLRGVCEGLGCLTRLRMLDLSLNGLDAAGMQSLCGGEVRLCELRSLNVSRNAICERGLKWLAVFVAGSSRLEMLDVSDQRELGAEGWHRGRRMLSAAGLKRLARLMCSSKESKRAQGTLIVARGCSGITASEQAAVCAVDRALQWEFGRGGSRVWGGGVLL